MTFLRLKIKFASPLTLIAKEKAPAQKITIDSRNNFLKKFVTNSNLGPRSDFCDAVNIPSMYFLITPPITLLMD